LPLAEKALIERIRRQAGKRRSIGVLCGIGDDCAVLRLPAGHEALVTTDFTFENTHFRRQWHPPETIGHRCLARGLSDIAAMGGTPIAAFLSLALPRRIPQSWVDRFMQGLLKLARRFDVTLAGGDTAESPGPIAADIVVLGSVPAGQAILRSGARPGDRIYVTGKLGGSAGALRELSRGYKLLAVDYPDHFLPQPRIEAGHILRQKKLASAMIDLSDGLSTDLAHICRESNVGAEIQAEAIPVARIGKPGHQVDLNLALHGGEDYELLFTVPGTRRVPSRLAGVAVTLIGHITRGKNITLRYENGTSERLQPRGWEHFRP
jgi:thiamine-monophosphate kinase